ncbi:IS3 family transposase [Nocardia farcinica]|uniref:IS3 family transposase n=1 Tax=Nocardia farcinica TaxID=37329 RepID=UPI003CC7FAF2
MVQTPGTALGSADRGPGVAGRDRRYPYQLRRHLGPPRVYAMLVRRGISVGRKRVERVMRGAGFQGASCGNGGASPRHEPIHGQRRHRIWSNGLHCG